MSEYQYYEFAAVDGPISDQGLRYARGCSSRAEVYPFRWRNVYHFGSFHGSVDTLEFKRSSNARKGTTNDSQARCSDGSHRTRN